MIDKALMTESQHELQEVKKHNNQLRQLLMQMKT